MLDKHYQEMLDFGKVVHFIHPEQKRSLPIICTLLDYWEVAKFWVIKLEWDNRVKPHQNKALSDALKPKGLFLQSIFYLCEKCVSYDETINMKVGMWYQHCVLELINMDIEQLHNPPKIYNHNYKKAFLDVEKNKLSLLKNHENPYEKPYLKSLIDTSISLCGKSNVFDKKYYKTFLTAYRGSIQEFESPKWAIGYMDNKDKYWVQGGKGRYGTQKIFRDTTRITSKYVL